MDAAAGASGYGNAAVRHFGAMRRSDPTLRAIAGEIGEICGAINPATYMVAGL